MRFVFFAAFIGGFSASCSTKNQSNTSSLDQIEFTGGQEIVVDISDLKIKKDSKGDPAIVVEFEQRSPLKYTAAFSVEGALAFTCGFVVSTQCVGWKFSQPSPSGAKILGNLVPDRIFYKIPGYGSGSTSTSFCDFSQFKSYFGAEDIYLRFANNPGPMSLRSYVEERHRGNPKVIGPVAHLAHNIEQLEDVFIRLWMSQVKFGGCK